MQHMLSEGRLPPRRRRCQLRLNRSQRLGLDLDRHILLDAGAGTGKTLVMAHRYLEHVLCPHQRAVLLLGRGQEPIHRPLGTLRAPTRERTPSAEWPGLLPTEVVAITFTRKAAAELKDRIRGMLTRLRASPSRNEPEALVDPRLRKAGDAEHLLAQLEVAPIGTIDAFLGSMVAPHLHLVMERPTVELISDSERPRLIDRTLAMAWRIRNPTDARVMGLRDGAERFIDARNRLTRRLGGIGPATGVAADLMSSSSFVEESSLRLRRHIASGGSAEAMPMDSVRDLVLSLSSDTGGLMDEAIDLLRTWWMRVLDHPKAFMIDHAMEGSTRWRAIDAGLRKEAPSDPWDRLQWFWQLVRATATASSMDRRVYDPLPKGILPTSRSDGGWSSGIPGWTGRPARLRRELRPELEAIRGRLGTLLASNRGQAAMFLGEVAYCIDPTHEWVGSDPAGRTIPVFIGNRTIDGGLERSGWLDHEAQGELLADLVHLHDGLVRIRSTLRTESELIDHDDVLRAAEDLLLVRCPDVVRTEWPESIVRALDDLPEDPWRDDHLIRARDLAGDHPRIQEELEHRIRILDRIRRRHRAFIIDEFQDTSPRQYRLLARLWGARTASDDEPKPPRGAWHPTVCLVGDAKQSIYRFRQAEVSGMTRARTDVGRVNRAERRDEDRLEHLRRPHQTRDPRPIRGGIGIASTFISARDVDPLDDPEEDRWVDFELDDRGRPIRTPEVLEGRRDGVIDLTTNFRTSPLLLRTLNAWFDHVLDPMHHLIHGPWHASAQALHAAPRSDPDDVGMLEWLLPSVDPDAPIGDPRHPGAFTSPVELEHELIADRVDGLVRVGPGPGHAPVDPSDILILVERRTHVADLVRRLRARDVPVVTDGGKSLLDCEAVLPLMAMLGCIAHPTNRRWFVDLAASPAMAYDDGALDATLRAWSDDRDGWDALIAHAPTPRLATYIEGLAGLARRGEVLRCLTALLDGSDLLVNLPNQMHRANAEAFVDLIQTMVGPHGEDPITLHEEIQELRRVGGAAIRSPPPASEGSVRIMTIHASKGLESEVVIVSGMFRTGAQSLVDTLRSPVLIAPEVVAARLRPHRSRPAIESGTRRLAEILTRSQIRAEQRRLLYVALTRVRSHLILSGSPRGTMVERDMLSLSSTSGWSFGRAIIDALASSGTGLWSSDSVTSLPEPWGQVPIPAGMHRPGLSTMSVKTDASKVANRPTASASEAFERIRALIDPSLPPPAPSSFNGDQRPRLRLAPSSLDSDHACARRHHLRVRSGWRSVPLRLSPAVSRSSTFPNPATLGSMVHRLIEIGLENPGQSSRGGRIPSRASRLTDPKAVDVVLNEHPGPHDEVATRHRLLHLGSLIESGPLGRWVGGESVDRLNVIDVRTELPFRHVRSFVGDGWEAEDVIEGRIDLVLVVRREDGTEGLMVIDLKTRGCGMPFNEKEPSLGHPLQEIPDRQSERTVAESELIHEHVLQLVAYTEALEAQEHTGQRREVLPPAVLVGASGRLLRITDAELEAGRLAVQEVRMRQHHLDVDSNPTLPERLDASEHGPCHTCPHAMGDIAICGPKGLDLGLRPTSEDGERTSTAAWSRSP